MKLTDVDSSEQSHVTTPSYSYPSQSNTSTTSGVTNSECLMPIEKEGGRGRCATTLSELCVPGPGVRVAALGMDERLCMENDGWRFR